MGDEWDIKFHHNRRSSTPRKIEFVQFYTAVELPTDKARRAEITGSIGLQKNADKKSAHL
jgi:hypothetical protein